MQKRHNTAAGTQAAEPESAAPTGGSLRVVVAYTRPAVAAETVAAALAMTAGLSATVVVAGVHVIPYPAPFHCPALVREHLEARLQRAAERAGDSAQAVLVLARSQEEGFRHAVRDGGSIVIGTRRRWWPTRETRLARRLKAAGCKVLLVHLEANRG